MKRRVPLFILLGVAIGGLSALVRSRLSGLPEGRDTSAERPDEPGSLVAMKAPASVVRPSSSPDPARSRDSARLPAPTVVGHAEMKFKPLDAMKLIPQSALPFYDREMRDPTWAPAMERNLKVRIAALVDSKFHDVKILDISCKTTLCKIAVNPAGRSAVLEDNELVPLASIYQPLTASDSYESGILVFGDENLAPENYPAWQATAKAKLRDTTPRTSGPAQEMVRVDVP
jgi:hypothetical protein